MWMPLIPDLYGDREWDYCKRGARLYVCVGHLQTSVMRAMRNIGANIMHSSSDGVYWFSGFPAAARNFQGATTSEFRQYLASAVEVKSSMSRRIHFQSGSNVSLRWMIKSDQPAAIARIMRKAGEEFAMQELYKHTSRDDHASEASATVDNVETKITMMQSSPNEYRYLAEVTISGASDADTGVYMIEARGGMKNFVEVMPEGAATAYPAQPNIRLEQSAAGPHIVVSCAAEGFDLDSISLKHNGQDVNTSSNEKVTSTATTRNTRGIAYRATPAAGENYSDYSGSYECVVTSADGTQTESQADFEFAEPAAHDRGTLPRE